MEDTTICPDNVKIFTQHFLEDQKLKPDASLTYLDHLPQQEHFAKCKYKLGMLVCSWTLCKYAISSLEKAAAVNKTAHMQSINSVCKMHGELPLSMATYHTIKHCRRQNLRCFMHGNKTRIFRDWTEPKLHVMIGKKVYSLGKNSHFIRF